jgi:hypothetical protein
MGRIARPERNNGAQGFILLRRHLLEPLNNRVRTLKVRLPSDRSRSGCHVGLPTSSSAGYPPAVNTLTQCALPRPKQARNRPKQRRAQASSRAAAACQAGRQPHRTAKRLCARIFRLSQIPIAACAVPSGCHTPAGSFLGGFRTPASGLWLRHSSPASETLRISGPRARLTRRQKPIKRFVAVYLGNATQTIQSNPATRLRTTARICLQPLRSHRPRRIILHKAASHFINRLVRASQRGLVSQSQQYVSPVGRQQWRTAFQIFSTSIAHTPCIPCNWRSQ